MIKLFKVGQWDKKRYDWVEVRPWP